MAVSEETRKRLAKASQGGGIVFPDKKPDRTHRILNYPGLQYFYDKLKNDGAIGNGIAGQGIVNTISFLTINPSDWVIETGAGTSDLGYRTTYPLNGDSTRISFKEFDTVEADGNSLARDRIEYYEPVFWELKYTLPEEFTGKVVRCLGATMSEMPHLTENSSNYADLSQIGPELRMWFGRSGFYRSAGKFERYTHQYQTYKDIENTIRLCNCSLKNERWSNGYFTLGHSFDDPFTESPPVIPSEPLMLMLEVNSPDVPSAFRFGSRDDIVGGTYGYGRPTRSDGTRITTRLYKLRGLVQAGIVFNSTSNSWVTTSDPDYDLIISYWKQVGYTVYSLYEYCQSIGENGALFSETLSDEEVRRILGGWEEGEMDESWNVRAADRLSHPRQIGIASPSGAVTGHASFDGTEDVTISVSHNFMTNEEIQAMLNEYGMTE